MTGVGTFEYERANSQLPGQSHVHFNLVSPISGCRVDHLGRQIGGSRSIMETLVGITALPLG